MHRLLYLVIFALLLGEALLFSPSARPDQTEWVIRLLTGDWAGEEPSVVALFQLMGVWPVAMLALLAPRLRRSPVTLWPFVLGSMVLGAFSLLPGLALGGATAPVARWQSWVGSRGLASLLLAAAVVLFGWAAVAGSPSRFLEIWRTDQFVHIMALDFVALSVASVVIAHEQREALGPNWWWAAVPLLGALALRWQEPVRVG